MKRQVTRATEVAAENAHAENLVTETSTKCADLGRVEGGISQKCSWDLSQVSVQVLLNPVDRCILAPSLETF